MEITNKQIAALNTLILRTIGYYEEFTAVPFSYWYLTDAINDIIQLFNFEDVGIGSCKELDDIPLFTRINDDRTIYYFNIYGDSSTYYDLEVVLSD